MINDENRREVAARLRGLRGFDVDGKKFCSCYDVEDALGLEGSIMCSRTAVETLADLIDRPTTTRHGKFKTKYGRETPCCEVCGYSIGDMRWNYCPKCGAEVVE